MAYSGTVSCCGRSFMYAYEARTDTFSFGTAPVSGFGTSKVRR
jgi:NADH:ubiquinone oxidoreductase subunit B-like Fe-S oxidoreductase